MRRTAALLVVAGAGLLPLTATAAPAYACAQPEEGEPVCCSPPRELTYVTVGDHTVVVHDPMQPLDDPGWC